MKKLIATLLSLSFVLALASCGDTESTSSVASTASTEPTSSTVSTVPAPSSAVVSTDVASTESTESTVEVEPGGNLAVAATAFSDGNNGNSDGDGALNDGNLSTRWQAADKDPETKDSPSWFGLEWSEEQTFDKIVLTWETAHPEEDGFYVQISEDGEEWTDVDFEAERTGTMNEELQVLESDKQVDTITIDEAVTTKYLRIYCFTHYVVPEGLENAGNTKSPSSCYEIEVYNTADAEDAE